ncbi:hypothetical protein C7212DRAFT_342376 [Tuber magnatum]|uniref:BED-type domain-containing protein n=1 Tax=Tuber magnatum TaxID=42249 RepID=A0A317SWQ2_9PEZI|nr:hypothetical protein C7212DRAFT_342376 [Tuber magnatum]
MRGSHSEVNIPLSNSLNPTGTASSSRPTLPTWQEHQQQFATPINAQCLPISSSVLTSIDSLFFEENRIHPTVDQNESSSGYFAQHSLPLLVSYEPATSPCLSTIPGIRISSDDDSEGAVHIVPVKRTHLVAQSFVHFHGSTSGLGLAKCWNCNYCKKQYVLNGGTSKPAGHLCERHIGHFANHFIRKLFLLPEQAR